MKPSVAAVHPEMQQIASKMPQLPFTARNLWLLRLLTKALIRPANMPAGVQVQNTFIPGPDSGQRLRLRLYQVQARPAQAPALLWIHGGGYVGGLPEMDDLYVQPFLQTAGVVVSVDYRLAPEHPYPAPLEDCYTALKWLFAQAQALGVDAQRIAIGGASAGGGLAASLAQLARQRGELHPAFQLLVYPMLDDRTARRTDIDPQAHFAWNNQSNRFGWQAYLHGEHAPQGAVPARQENLAGLPPAWIGVGAIDLFHDEDVAYARRLKEAGVPCELVVTPGAFHGFDISAPQTQVVKDFRSNQARALRDALIA